MSAVQRVQDGNSRAILMIALYNTNVNRSSKGRISCSVRRRGKGRRIMLIQPYAALVGGKFGLQNLSTRSCQSRV